MSFQQYTHPNTAFQRPPVPQLNVRRDQQQRNCQQPCQAGYQSSDTHYNYSTFPGKSQIKNFEQHTSVDDHAGDTSHFNKNPYQQGNSSFQQTQHQSNAINRQIDYTQRPHNVSSGLNSVTSPTSNQYTSCEQSNESHRYQLQQMSTFNQLPQKHQNQPHQRPEFPSLISQTPCQSNVISNFNNNPTSQQENRSFQQQTQAYSQSTPNNQQTGNIQQLYNIPAVSTSMSSTSQQTKCLQSSGQHGLNQTMQFPTFNQVRPNSQYHLYQNSLTASHNSQISVHSNVNSHVNNIPPSQQQNTSLQQQTQLCYSSNVGKHQTGSMQSGLTSISSSISNQHVQFQQNSGSNQTPWIPTFNQLPPNSHPQLNQRSVFTPNLQISNQSNATNQNPSAQQDVGSFQLTQQHHQTSRVNCQSANAQQPYDIPSGFTSMTVPSPIQNQYIQHPQNNNGPPGLCQTSQLPLNSQSNQKPVLACITQVSNQSNIASNFNSIPVQQGNVNVQQQTLLYNQSSAVNHQSNNTKPSYNNSSQLICTLPICNELLHKEESNKPCGLNNQISQFPAFNQLSSSSQQQSLQGPELASSASQISVLLPGPPAQSELSSSAMLQHGPPSNFINSFPSIIYTQHQFGNYQTIGNVPAANNDANVKSQSEIDSEWMSQWLVTRGKRKIQAENERSILIPEVRKQLYQALSYLKILSHIRDSLKTFLNEGEIWEHRIKQAMSVKRKLNTIMEKLLQPGVTLQLIRKLRKIKKKRVLHRRQREKRKLQRLEQKKKQLEIRHHLDSYMETEKEKVLQVKREEEMKKEADNILSEVRRKLQEGKRALERLRTIEKLRQTRKDTATKRGLHISEKTDIQFNNKISFLKDIIHRQLIDYDAEEKALKVMLETEQEGQREQEEMYRKERQKKLFNKMKKQIKECLFGNNDSLDTSDPLSYFRQYYTQAENNLDALVQTRHQWDIYLVRPTDTCGSSIPVSWITPDPPSSHSWASAIDLKDCE